MTRYAISNPVGLYLKVTPGLDIVWVQRDFNKYPSKYAAKKHLKELDKVSDDVKVIPVVTE